MVVNVRIDQIDHFGAGAAEFSESFVESIRRSVEVDRKA